MKELTKVNSQQVRGGALSLAGLGKFMTMQAAALRTLEVAMGKDQPKAPGASGGKKPSGGSGDKKSGK